MRTLRKGEAFPQVRRRSRKSSLTGSCVIRTSPGLAPARPPQGAALHVSGHRKKGDKKQC